MTVGELAAYLKEHWPTIRGQLLDGTYKPQPVRRVEIPKPRQAACDRSAFPRCSIASSSKRRCRCCKRIGTRSRRAVDAFPTVAFCSASIWASRFVGSSPRPRIVRHLADRGWCTRRSWQLAFLANNNESGCRTFKAHGGELRGRRLRTTTIIGSSRREALPRFCGDPFRCY